MISRSRVTLSDLLELHYLPQNLQIGSLQADQYRTLKRLIERWQQRTCYADELSREFVFGFLGWLRELGRANGTLNSKRSLLRPLWSYAFEQGFTQEQPCVIRRLREPLEIPEAWTVDQIRTLLRVTWRLRGLMRNGVPRAGWWSLLVFLCFLTGLRIKSVRRLRWTWMRDDGWIYIPAEAVKEFKGRRLQLPPRVVQLAARLRIEGDDHMLPWPYSHRQLWKFWRQRVVGPSGLPMEVRKCGFHRFRKSYASYLEKARPGTAAQVMHEDPRVTRERYIDPLIAGDFNPADLLPDLESPWDWDRQRRLFE